MARTRTSHLIINYGLRAFLAAKLLPLVLVVLVVLNKRRSNDMTLVEAAKRLMIKVTIIVV